SGCPAPRSAQARASPMSASTPKRCSRRSVWRTPRSRRLRRSRYRVPGAMQRSSRCFAEPGPTLRFALAAWAPALQRLASQVLRAALRPGHASPRMQRQLLPPPVQQFRHIQRVLRRTRHRMDPAELLQLLAGLAEHAEHFAVEAELVDA